VEKIEKAKNAQLAREIEIALPRELTREQGISLVREYVKEQFVNAGMCADFAIHDTGGGNPHAHIMLTMRPIQQSGAWGAKQKKEYILDPQGKKIYDPKKRQYNAAIKASIPETKEKISWSMPTYWKGRNLIQFAASKRHIGLYPGPEAVEAFAGRLTEYKTSKGAIQLPYSKPLPLELIGEIARWCEDNI